MAVFVFYRIPLDFLQKEWMYRGVMLRIMSPGRFCLQGRAYRFHPVSMREAWQVCFVRSFRNSKCGFPPFGPSDSRSGACQTQRTRTQMRSGSLCLTLRFIYTRLPPLRAFRKLAKAGPVLHSYKWFWAIPSGCRKSPEVPDCYLRLSFRTGSHNIWEDTGREDSTNPNFGDRCFDIRPRLILDCLASSPSIRCCCSKILSIWKDCLHPDFVIYYPVRVNIRFSCCSSNPILAVGSRHNKVLLVLGMHLRRGWWDYCFGWQKYNGYL